MENLSIASNNKRIENLIHKVWKEEELIPRAHEPEEIDGHGPPPFDGGKEGEEMPLFFICNDRLHKFIAFSCYSTHNGK